MYCGLEFKTENQSFFGNGESIDMSQSVLKKLQEVKQLKMRQQEELKRQQQDLLNFHSFKPTLLSEKSIFIDKVLLKSDFNDNVQLDDDNKDEKLENILEQSQEEDEDINTSQQSKDSAITSLEDDVPDDNTQYSCEIENSFENSSSPNFNLDDIPVKNMIEIKSFEDMLEEQLAKEANKAPPITQNTSVFPKKFLRKGQGTARFNGPPKKPIKPIKTQTVGHKIETQKISDQTLPSIKPNKKEETNESSSEVKKCVPMRKVARLASRQVIPKLKLIRNEQPSIIQRSLASKDLPEDFTDINADDYNDEDPDIDVNADDYNDEDPDTDVNADDYKDEDPDIDVNADDYKDEDPDTDVNADDYKDEDSDTDVNAGDDVVGVFDDEQAWSDISRDSTVVLEATEIEGMLKTAADPNQTSNETFEQIEKYCNKYFNESKQVIDLDQVPTLRCVPEEEEEPRNKLMLSLFPSLRPAAKKESLLSQKPPIQKNRLQKPQNQKLPVHKSQAHNPPVHQPKVFQPQHYADPNQPPLEYGLILKNKLEELQEEIKVFQSETAALKNSKDEVERHLKALQSQTEELEEMKKREMQEIEKWKKSERLKLKKERKIFEDHVTTVKKELPTKSDKDLIQELRKELVEVRAEAKKKEQRLSAITNRLRSQLEVMTSENRDLKELVISLETKVAESEKLEQRRQVKQTNRMWRELNNLIDSSTSSQLPVTSSNHNSTSGSSPNTSNKVPPTCVSRDKKEERVLSDGGTEVIYFDDTRKIVSEDGLTTQVIFSNGDVRTKLPDGSETYFYKASGTRRTTQPDGVQRIEFENQQVERHFIDGSKHITFANGSSKLIKPDGSEETSLPDGTCMRLLPNGDKLINFANGQREIHTSDFKRREYPDGTCKTVFSDGRQETKYSSGRLRVKDPSGRVVVDAMLPTSTAEIN